ncbi:PREDICTED: thermospermine synthase ACAULIS5-like [Brassica oleracea var. oleracea]|uniref:thermospermine synthase ACAULIS5-like n=1 Tax=Brassica oleracea var. oleracea TaxID=109376 RepID=UPI0006A73A48|nr:PREDICTED: thermospermine synthase ACAULIS5-like [Brassica oleracea var. oleracea]
MGEVVEIMFGNAFPEIHKDTTAIQTLHSNQQEGHWSEETIDDDLKWSFALNSVLHEGTIEYQEMALLDTKRFRKIHFRVLVIDGKMQSAEKDEFIYHECLIHPALLLVYSPKTVFIMGGGEGSASREILKHKTIEKVVMCDIDQEVVDFCRRFLTVKSVSLKATAFCNKKLELVIKDAKQFT